MTINSYQKLFIFGAMTLVTPFFTFPSISWWMQAAKASLIIFDGTEHFEKMTNRNRYQISGANNKILLSIPLINGRHQHVPMKEVRIHNEVNWQLQHWRTLVSVYKRAPYFEYYEESLRLLFEARFTNLIDFNVAGMEWVKLQLKMSFMQQEETTNYIKHYPEGVKDIRAVNKNDMMAETPRYYQIFEERIGFLPDLSILDLLFSEGPLSVNKLKKDPFNVR